MSELEHISVPTSNARNTVFAVRVTSLSVASMVRAKVVICFTVEHVASVLRLHVPVLCLVFICQPR